MQDIFVSGFANGLFFIAIIYQNNCSASRGRGEGGRKQTVGKKVIMRRKLFAVCLVGCKIHRRHTSRDDPISPPPSIKSCTIFAFCCSFWSGILYTFGLRWRFFLIFTSYVFVKEDEDSLFKRRTSFPRHRGQNSFSGLLFSKRSG